jgi:hypothetical protein
VGEHAFPSKPGYQQTVESVPTIRLVRAVGLSGNWNMPVALWHSSNGWRGERPTQPSEQLYRDCAERHRRVRQRRSTPAPG